MRKNVAFYVKNKPLTLTFHQWWGKMISLESWNDKRTRLTGSRAHRLSAPQNVNVTVATLRQVKKQSSPDGEISTERADNS